MVSTSSAVIVDTTYIPRGKEREIERGHRHSSGCLSPATTTTTKTYLLNGSGGISQVIYGVTSARPKVD